jgi:4-diphosphocytidyl-2-C-methyl-D-erythritol kinase
MHIEALDRGLVICSPAKLNLFLEVLGIRADGYHEIDSIMCPVTLFDELRVEESDSGRIEFSIASTADSAGATAGILRDDAPRDPAWDIPADPSNLVVRALEAVRSELGATSGCRVTLHKRIPAAAGLGGGSSDAAAAIVAGLVLWSNWDRGLATRVASRLGSDIPLFFGDAQNGIGLARATGRGERVEILAGRPPLCFAISHPPVGSSTAEVYKLCVPAGQTVARDRMLAACKSESAEAASAIEQSLFNALQAPASRLTDWISRQLQCFAQLGKPQAMMSGSGSACFAMVDTCQEGRELSEKLIALGLPRAYAARAWYAAPIEQQLERIA